MFWNNVIREYWSELASGKKLFFNVAPHYHPAHAGGFRVNTGWPDGQQCDYTMSLSDGSRIHVQCFGSHAGRVRLRVHRDRYDPDQGLGNLILHSMIETPIGAIAATLAVVAAFGGSR